VAKALNGEIQHPPNFHSSAGKFLINEYLNYPPDSFVVQFRMQHE
jgi:hypothetical protein